MAIKKFKTVSGLLRSHDYNIEQQARKLEGDARKVFVNAEQRRIINHLLPQIDGLPTIADDEAPLDGINRLLALGGTDRQIKALKDCARWVKNFRIITITVHPQVKTADGLVSYHVQGFSRADHKVRVNVIVDAEEYGGNAFEKAEAIAGPDYCFISSGNLHHLVPDSAKNKLFLSDEEMYAADPEMAPKSKRRGIASYQSGGVASAAPASPFTIYRGYGVQQVDGSWVVSKNGKLSTQPTEQAALDWINAAKAEEGRKKEPAQPATEPAPKRKKTPLPPSTPWRQ